MTLEIYQEIEITSAEWIGKYPDPIEYISAISFLIGGYCAQFKVEIEIAKMQAIAKAVKNRQQVGFNIYSQVDVTLSTEDILQLSSSIDCKPVSKLALMARFKQEIDGSNEITNTEDTNKLYSAIALMATHALKEECEFDAEDLHISKVELGVNENKFMSSLTVTFRELLMYK